MKSQYDIERMKYSDLAGSIQLPPYQRRLVWSAEQKKNFIDNISKGYPFGSILLYRYEGKKQLSLIDGLQRYSTLREYEEQPENYFTNYSPYIDKIFNQIEKGNNIVLSLDQHRDIEAELTKIIRNVLSDPQRTPRALRDTIRSEIPLYPTHHDGYLDYLLDLQEELVNDARRFLDLDNLTIPCIVFTGPEEQLPDVFANLNQGGTKLSKYQVLAAQWSQYEIALPESHLGNILLERVIDRYQNLLEERDLEIDGFDPQEMRENRRINLSEYCFALGELVAAKAEVFWGKLSTQDLSKREDTVNVLGYLSTAIALNVDNRSIAKLPNKRFLFQDPAFVDSLTEKVLHEYGMIQAAFEPWLRTPGKGESKKYESAAITDMQALSFFAELWHKHYILDEDAQIITVIENFKSKGYEQSRRNLVAYCISDIIGHMWQGAGDSRLASFYIPENATRNSYYVGIERDALNERLLAWYEEATAKPSINVDKVSRLLLCVFSSTDANKYTSDRYDVEHIIAKDKFRHTAGIPGGVLGNLMYLTPRTNRGKKSRNLFFLNDHEGAAYADEYLEMIRYPSRTEIDTAEEKLSQGSTEEATSLIINRGKEMLSFIANAVTK